MSDGPDTRSTEKLSQSEIQAQLLKKLQDTVESGFARVSADIGLVANDVTVVKDRVAILEKRQDETDKRLDGNSMRARSASEVDSKHDAAIADIKTKVESVEGKLDTLLSIATHAKEGAATVWQKVRASPYARLLAVALFVQLSNYLYQRYHIQLPPIGGAQ